MRDTVELEIESIAAGGDGVGRVDGLVVFAPRTAPGDRIRAQVERGKRFAHASGIEVIRPAPDRVVPPCPHYDGDGCGGCQLQHLPGDAQRRAKAGIIRDAFTRIAKRPVDLPEIRYGQRAWRYRGKLTLALRRRGNTWLAGLHRFDDPAAIFALDDCPITDALVVSVWREVLAVGHLLPETDSLRASVRLVDGGAALVVAGGDVWSAADALLAAVPSLVAVWWVPAGAHANRRRVAVRETGEGSGASFTQVNAEVAELMREHILALARARAPRRVVDAYAGVGDTAEPLARDGARVVAIELDRDASASCGKRLPAGSHSVNDAVERALPTALPADLVILNPPRAGVANPVTRALEAASLKPDTIIYVSCDPATLARDLSRLPSYRVASVVAFDMFPQTAHVETVCELRLAANEAAA